MGLLEANTKVDSVDMVGFELLREGIPKKRFTKTQIEGAKKLYSILSEIGGKELVGNAKELSPGTFWSN